MAKMMMMTDDDSLYAELIKMFSWILLKGKMKIFVNEDED